MARSWKKYLNQQKYMECQLVTAINAYYHLTGKSIKIDSEEYEELVDLCKGRFGAAINIYAVYDKLGIEVDENKMFLSDFIYEFDKKDLGKKIIHRSSHPFPIELLVYHKKTGYHSVCVVDYSSKCKAFRICNFRQVTTHGGWVFEEDLYQWEIPLVAGRNGINGQGKKWRCRSFKLKEEGVKNEKAKPKKRVQQSRTQNKDGTQKARRSRGNTKTKKQPITENGGESRIAGSCKGYATQRRFHHLWEVCI